MRKKKATKTKPNAKISEYKIVEDRNLLVAEYFASKKNRQRKREIEKKIVELDTQYEQTGE